MGYEDTKLCEIIETSDHGMLMCRRFADHDGECIFGREVTPDMIKPPIVTTPDGFMAAVEGINEAVRQRGEIRTTSATGGQKGVKLEQFDQIPVEALRALAILYGNGAAKYEAHNFRKGYEWSKSYNAMLRHMTAFWGGEDMDEEMGVPHIICAIWHGMALFTFMQEHPEYDDRYSTLNKEK